MEYFTTVWNLGHPGGGRAYLKLLHGFHQLSVMKILCISLYSGVSTFMLKIKIILINETVGIGDYTKVVTVIQGSKNLVALKYTLSL